MKKATVERMYTAKVAELLNLGWRVHTSTMPGHQGEIAHIDLTDGTEVRRVLLYREIMRYTSFIDRRVVIQVGRYNDRIVPGWDSTLWNNRLEVLSEIELAEIQQPDCHRPEGWFTDMATAEDIGRVRKARWCARHEQPQPDRERALGGAYKSIALRWLRKQPRMKTARLEDITKLTRYTTCDRRVGYKIEAKGKNFTLRANKPA